MTMKRNVAWLTFLLLTALSLCAQQLEDSWTGKLDLGNAKLTIVMNFSRDTLGHLVCTMDSPNQGAKGIPATVENEDPSSLEVRVQALGVVYKAALVDDELRGTFSQQGYSFPLNLKRGTMEQKRPQEPQPPFSYKTEDVVVKNAADGVCLAGTLTYPIGFETQAKGTVPVVIMVTGSGTQDRNETLMEHKPFLVLADYLARHGIASLRYDDRGAGQSTGDATTITMQSNTRDATAVVDYVRQTGNFGLIGVLGHSEGGCRRVKSIISKS